MKCIPLHILTKDIDHDSTADTFFRKKLIPNVFLCYWCIQTLHWIIICD